MYLEKLSKQDVVADHLGHPLVKAYLTNLGRVAVLLASVGGHLRGRVAVLGALGVGALLVDRLLLVVGLRFSYSWGKKWH